jgi:hypothetical protein
VTLYWHLVLGVYAVDMLLFGFLAAFFWQRHAATAGEARPVMFGMALLSTVLFLQELYFGVNTLLDPAKLGFGDAATYAAVNSVWIFAKLLLTLGGAGIVYALYRARG